MIELFDLVLYQERLAWIGFMVFNATFNNIGEGNRGARRKPQTCRKSPTSYQEYNRKP